MTMIFAVIPYYLFKVNVDLSSEQNPSFLETRLCHSQIEKADHSQPHQKPKTHQKGSFVKIISVIRL